MPQAGGESESVCTDGTKLSLRGLLHYLWDQAELTKWHPGFAGKRTWGTVHRQLLSASEGKFARGDSLRSHLYIPETFFLDQRDEITARRSAQWLHALSVPGRPQHLMLLIGEVKEIVPARYGFKVVVKHVPDQGFAIDQQLYRRLGRQFETELALWGTCEHIRMVIIATFSVSGTGVPTIVELSLMPVTRHWLPIEDGLEERLIERLVTECRSFVKGLRYKLAKESTFANATLTDCDGSTPLLFVVKEDSTSGTQSHRPKLSPSIPAWLWYSSSEAMPPLPPRRTARFSPLDSHTPHTWSKNEPVRIRGV